MKKFSMFVLIIGAILFALSFFFSVKPKSEIPPAVQKAFKLWQIRQGKNYASPAEHKFRLGVFYKTYLRIKRKEGKVGYKMGFNQFSDMTLKEVKTKHFGYKKLSNNLDPNSIIDVNELPQSPPKDWDWRKKGAVTHVKDQGNCGSCWAFSTTGGIEGLYAIKNSKVESFSEQYLVDCAKNGNYGCDGGEMTNAYTYIQKHGIPLEKAYPYTAEDGKCNKKAKTFWKIDGWKQLKKHKSEALIAAVYQQPISIGIEADEILDYKSGIFDDSSCGTNLDHGVLMIGYGTSKGEDFWLVKNSWATSWGENGYIRFKREMKKKTNVCGILLESEFPTVKK